MKVDQKLRPLLADQRLLCIVSQHLYGIAADLESLREMLGPCPVAIIEDAAQAINALYGGRALGSLGHLGAYSFHDTKNVTCGEGGALCINRPELLGRAEIIRDKGTNRQQFFRREVEKYVWL